MIGWANWGWFFPTAGVAIGVLGTALMGWALFWDRSRGRRRCRRCWYQMDGIPAASGEQAQNRVCPECGARSIRDSDLYKTRRHWRVFSTGLLVLVSANLVVAVPRIQREGWTGAVPTRALVLGSPLIFKHEVPPNVWTQTREWEVRYRLSRALQTRVASDDLWPVEWRLLAAFALHDSPRRILGLAQMGFGYGPVLARGIERGRLDSEARQKIESLVALPLWTRPSWPTGIPIVCQPSILSWNETGWSGYAIRATATPTSPGLQAFSHTEQLIRGVVSPSITGLWDDGLIEIGSVHLPVTALNYSVVFERNVSVAPDEWAPVCRLDEAYPIALVVGVNDLVRPVSSTPIEQMLRTSKASIAPLSDGRQALALDFDPRVLLAEGNPTLALRVEVFEAGRLVFTGRAWWRVSILGPWDGYAGHLTPRGEWIPLTAVEPAGDGPLSVRLTGDPVVALRNFYGYYHWAGQVELPVEKYYGPFQLHLDAKLIEPEHRPNGPSSP